MSIGCGYGPGAVTRRARSCFSRPAVASLPARGVSVSTALAMSAAVARASAIVSLHAQHQSELFLEIGLRDAVCHDAWIEPYLERLGLDEIAGLQPHHVLPGQRHRPPGARMPSPVPSRRSQANRCRPALALNRTAVPPPRRGDVLVRRRLGPLCRRPAGRLPRWSTSGSPVPPASRISTLISPAAGAPGSSRSSATGRRVLRLIRAGCRRGCSACARPRAGRGGRT